MENKEKEKEETYGRLVKNEFGNLKCQLDKLNSLYGPPDTPGFKQPLSASPTGLEVTHRHTLEMLPKWENLTNVTAQMMDTFAERMVMKSIKSMNVSEQEAKRLFDMGEANEKRRQEVDLAQPEASLKIASEVEVTEALAETGTKMKKGTLKSGRRVLSSYQS